MNESLDMSAQQPWLDLVALVNAQQRHDGLSINRVLETADLHHLVLVLTQQLATAIRSPKMTLQEFLDETVDKAIRGAELDAQYRDLDGNQS